MLLELVGVACAAIDTSERGVVGKILALEIGVAVGTGERAMNGRLELLAIDKARDCFSSFNSGKAFVAVAGQAIVIRDVGGTGSRP